MLGEELLDELFLMRVGRFADRSVGEKAGIVLAGDLVGRGRLAPGRGNLGIAQQALDTAARLGGDQKRADALAARAARAAGAVEQGGGIARQVRMDHEA